MTTRWTSGVQIRRWKRRVLRPRPGDKTQTRTQGKHSTQIMTYTEPKRESETETVWSRSSGGAGQERSGNVR